MKRYAVAVTGPDEIELTIGPDHNSRSVLLSIWDADELIQALDAAVTTLESRCTCKGTGIDPLSDPDQPWPCKQCHGDLSVPRPRVSA